MAARRPPTPTDSPVDAPVRLTGAQISAINRFPDDNPNPVMRVDADSRLMYANPASRAILRHLGVDVGDALPTATIDSLSAAAADRGFIEVVADDRTYAIWPVPLADLGLTNLYGTDVTAERAIVKFPDQNPNPVFRIRWDGTLAYANPASAQLIAGLGLSIGASLPPPFRDQLLERVRAGDHVTEDVDVAGRSYALLPVDVPEFGFINVYGTDVTAVKERERLARENERLLLNILPGPVADRLRAGEALIADRFDDVTLLFADVVEFTHLSSSLSPQELVRVLNDIFTVFDDLVDRYGLEKVKTIGDAYMVVGGMQDPADDHTARVAAMALDLASCVAGIPAAARLAVTFRIGMHVGPVVAGVIGTKKFIYDVWGDTVNLASRMESLGIPGRIQVTQEVHDRLAADFEFEARGVIDVKGKGPMPTYLLTGGRAATDLITSLRARA